MLKIIFGICLNSNIFIILTLPEMKNCVDTIRKCFFKKEKKKNLKIKINIPPPQKKGTFRTYISKTAIFAFFINGIFYNIEIHTLTKISFRSFT